MDIQFRSIKKQDIENIVHMCAESGYEVRYEILSARIKNLSENENSTVIVAIASENTPAGWIQLERDNFILSDNICNILALYVDNIYRGRQIGKYLIEEAEKWAKNKKCKSLKIHSDIIRVDSNRFYTHIGFKHMKTKQSFLKPIEL